MKWLGFSLKLTLTGTILIFSCQEIIEQCSIDILSNQLSKVITKSSGFGTGLILLSFCNWGAEARKWQIILPSEIRFLNALESVLIGLGLSAFLPRIAGESIGRFTSHTGRREEVLSGVLLSKILQTSLTFFMFLFGFFYFYYDLIALLKWDFQFLFLAFFAIPPLFLFLFKVSIPERLLAPFYALTVKRFLRVFWWTMLRYASFLGQSLFVMLLLDLKFDFFPMVAGLMVMYGLRLVTVSLNVAVDLGIRFSTAIFVLQQLRLLVDVNDIIAIFTLVWLFNVVLPTVVGGVLISVKKWG